MSMIMILVACKTQYTLTEKKSMSDEKCFARMLSEKAYEESIRPYPLYTGENYDESTMEKVQYVITPVQSKWEKTKIKDCTSDDPKDCEVYCLVETPAEHEEVYVVIDTVRIKDYVWTDLHDSRLPDGKHFYWMEVECD